MVSSLRRSNSGSGAGTERAKLARGKKEVGSWMGGAGSLVEAFFAKLEGLRAAENGCMSRPMVPFWGRCTTHFGLFWWGWGFSLGYGILTHSQMSSIQNTPSFLGVRPSLVELIPVGRS